MITALIAEDELLVRIGISSCVPWGELGVRLVGETDNGQEAWELCRRFRPDIVITDIRMPGLSGLELLRRIRAEDMTSRVILITNVDNNETLSLARQYGVSDILLKAVMKKNDISAAVQKACASLVSDGAVAESGETGSSWQEILFQNSPAKPPFALQGMVGLRIFPEQRLSHQLQLSLSNLVVHRLNCPDAFATASKGSCLLILWKESPLRYTSEEKLIEFARYVQDNFQLRIGIVLRAVAAHSDPVRDAQSVIDLLHEESYFDRAVLDLDADGNYQRTTLLECRREVMRELPLQNGNAELERLSRLLKLYPGTLEHGFAFVRRSAEELLRLLHCEDSFNGLEEMTGWICERAHRMVKSGLDSIRPEIRQVLDYIADHLQEDLSLEKVCALSGYHSTYFSRLFKTEVGTSFSDYVLCARMVQAQFLLQSTLLPVSIVAEQCGFSEISYFSARFKQFCGLSPRQWREKK